MKKLFLFAAALSFILSSCQNELEDQTLSNDLNTVTASIESQSSRLAVLYDYETNIFGLSWSENDGFTAFGDNSTNANYTWVSGGTFGTNQTAPTNPAYAIYPTSSSLSMTGTTVTMTLPASFNASAINLPMWSGAPVDNNYSFKHLAAGLRIDTKSIPAGYNTLTVEASNAINGTFTADLSNDNPLLAFSGTVENDNKKVTVTFDAATDENTKDQVFYVPLPAGEYTSLVVKVSNGTNTIDLKSWSYLTIARGKMYYTTAVINASTVAGVNKALESAAEVPVAVNIPGAITIDEAINIPTAAKVVTLNFGETLTTSESVPLTINQNADEEPAEATSELNIVSEKTIAYTEINTPKTTVTLSKGTYTTVTATTATNTLIIKNWVAIANLIVNGGNVIIEDGATVGTIINEGKGSITNRSTIKTVQDALDNAVDGTTIQLEAGVNYGTLVFRQRADNKFVDINDAGGDAKNNERFSSYKNITIIGAPGAVVDQIDFQVGWDKDERYTSNASYIAIENLKIQNVTFSGEKTAINLDSSKGGSLGIDGLTIDGCTMVDADGDDRFVFQQISGNKQLKDKTTSEDVMTTGVKNLTINNCTVTGAYQVLESRAMENLTITNNTFNGIKMHNMLITSDVINHADKTYAGTITITSNTSTGGEERFVRASLNNSAVTVTIKNNTITDYKGEDADWIKVTEYAGTPDISNNTCTYAVATVEELKTALAAATDGTIINLATGTYEGLSFTDPANYRAKNITIVGQNDGTTIINGFDVNTWTESSNIEINGLTFKNITFSKGLLLSTKVMNNVTVENSTFINDACIKQDNRVEKLINLVVKDCTFIGADENKISNGTGVTAIMLENTENVKVENCTFTNIDFNVLQGGVLTGTVLIDNNTVNGTGDRVFRFVDTSNVDITISNNTITSDGDAAGELAKTTNAAKITLTNNTWNGKTDAEVANKFINITVK